eukprot:GFUD01011911.1.p1 GENE.GFUD01011911.1~~GFUD01011911.1.p1  ORF type:complete len:347 (+),score=95.10 GFUD01011911.1:617-1657(+)
MIPLSQLARFVPQLILCVTCLTMHIFIYPTCSLVVGISEAVFYLVCGYFVSHAILHGKKKHSDRTQLLSFLLMPTFAIILLAGQDRQIHFSIKVKKETYLRILQNTVTVSLVMVVLNYLRVFITETETRKMLKKSKHHLGPGLARTFFSFLEMLTKREHGTPGLENVLARYASSEHIHIHPKVFILFPRNTSQSAGSHSWMFAKEKEYNLPDHLRRHGPVQFTFQGTIVHSYFLNGKNRDIDLAVIKIKNTETKKVYYAAIAENRPLITLQKMKNMHSLRPPFCEEDFQLQSQIYKKNLTSLIEEDPACRDSFEIVDMQGGNGDFTVKIYDRVTAANHESCRKSVN